MFQPPLRKPEGKPESQDERTSTMSPQNRPRSRADRSAQRHFTVSFAMAATLDQLCDHSIPDAVNMEIWLDRIDAGRDAEVRP